MAIEGNFVTTIGSQWADPIADLAFILHKRILERSGSHHLTLAEQGVCFSLIVLLVLMLESYTLRGSKHADDFLVTKATKNKKFSARNWWRDSAFVSKEKLVDTFLLRDAIAHNHLYLYDFKCEPNDYVRINAGGDAFVQRTSSGRFKASDLCCIPNLLGPTDVLCVSKLVYDALNFLRSINSDIGMVDFSFAKRGKANNMWEVIEFAIGAMTLKKLE